MARRARSAALGLLLAACGGDGAAVRTVDVSTAGDAVIALVLLDGEGAPVEVLPAFGVVDGALDFGTRPERRLEGAATDVAWVRLSRDALEAGFPSGWANRSTVRFRLGPPPTPAEVVTAADDLRQTWTAALPSGAEIFGADEATIRGGIAMRIELEAEPCRQADRSPLVPYADRARPLPANDLRGLTLLDARRAVVAGAGGVYVLERGRAFEDGPGHRLGPDDLGANTLFVDALAVERDTLGTDAVRFVAGVQVRPLPNVLSRVLQFTLTPEGFTDVRTATVVPFRVWDIDVGPDRAIVVTSDRRRVLLSGPDGVGWRRHDVETITSDTRVRAVTFTGLESEPILAGSMSRLHALPAGGGPWRNYGATFFEGTVVIRAIHTVDAVTYVGASRNDLYRRDGTGEFDYARVMFPPRAGRCADAGAERQGRLSMIRDIHALAIEPRGPVIAYRECDKLFRIRWADRCVSVIPNDQPSASGAVSFHEVQVLGDDIVAVDDEGRVLLSERR